MKKRFYVFCLGISVLAGCTSSSNQSGLGQEMTDSTNVAIAKDQNIVFPSPLQIASIFRKSGLIYMDNITNDVNNLNKYESQISKSLNFGVYSADLAYSVLNNQKQNSLEYLKCVRKLSNDLGISSVFNAESLFESFEKNVGHEDSLIQILSVVQEKLDDHLQATESEHAGTIYFIGGWVEAMYLGTQVMESSDNVELTQHMMEQTALLELIMRAIQVNPYKNDPQISSINSKLEALNKMVYSFEFIKGRQIDEIPMEEVELTGDEIQKLSLSIEELRSIVVNS